jgi:hypothetical protein
MESGNAKRKLKAIPDWPYPNETETCKTSPDHIWRITAAALAKGYLLTNLSGPGSERGRCLSGVFDK